MVNGEGGAIEDIFLDFSPYDRLGFVVNSDTRAIGASVQMTAAITRFYDFFREQLGNEDDKLRIYPKYYIFHVGKQNVEHGALDIWPPIIMRESFNNATTRIKTALAFSPGGHVEDADVEVTNNTSIEEYVLMAIKDAKQYSGEEYEKVLNDWEAAKDGGFIKQSFRFINALEAICMLTTNTDLTINTSKNIDTVVGSGPEDFVFSPHIHVGKFFEKTKTPGNGNIVIL